MWSTELLHPELTERMLTTEMIKRSWAAATQRVLMAQRVAAAQQMPAATSCIDRRAQPVKAPANFESAWHRPVFQRPIPWP
jgi:hypothetical protein